MIQEELTQLVIVLLIISILAVFIVLNKKITENRKISILRTGGIQKMAIGKEKIELLISHLRNNSREQLTRLSKDTRIPVSTIFDLIRRLRKQNIITEMQCKPHSHK